MGMRLFAQITKIDEAKREVWGRAVQEIPDRADEIFDYATSVPFFKEWSSSFEKTTNGKSLGNIRGMHGTVAAGKAIKVDFNDGDKAIDIGTKIVDENEFKKCLEGVYTGFSIGGKYVNKWADGPHTRYTARPSEISLVDNPCIPTATFYDVVKADGTVLQKSFQTNEQAVDEIAKLLTDGTVSPKRLLELAKADEGDDADSNDDELTKPAEVSQDEWDDMDADEKEAACEEYGKAAKSAPVVSAPAKDTVPDAKPSGTPTNPPSEASTPPPAAKADAPDDLNKGLYNVQSFANCLESCSYIARSAQSDFDAEGDNSPIPAQLRAWIAAGAGIFKAMAAEEADELVANLTTTANTALQAYGGEVAVRRAINANDFDLAAVPALAEAHLTKAERDAIGEKATPARLLTALVAKFGKGDGKDDIGPHLQGAHDCLVKCGLVKCADSMKVVPGGDLTKTHEILQKAFADLEARLKKVEDSPAPAKGVLRTVGKGEDNPDDAVVKGGGDEIVSTPGQHNPEAALALIKKQVFASPMRGFGLPSAP